MTHGFSPRPVLTDLNETAEERYWAKVSKGPGCWEWTGALDARGYGNFYTGKDSDGKTRYVRAHRLGWAMENGPLPDGALILHLCDNPGCVNPAHLEPGDHKENHRQAVDRGLWRRPSPPHGERVNTAKLTREMVRQIRHVYDAGQKDGVTLARIFGVTPANIGYIVRRESWKQVA